MMAISYNAVDLAKWLRSMGLQLETLDEIVEVIFDSAGIVHCELKPNDAHAGPGDGNCVLYAQGDDSGVVEQTLYSVIDLPLCNCALYGLLRSRQLWAGKVLEFAYDEVGDVRAMSGSLKLAEALKGVDDHWLALAGVALGEDPGLEGLLELVTSRLTAYRDELLAKLRRPVAVTETLALVEDGLRLRGGSRGEGGPVLFGLCRPEGEADRLAEAVLWTWSRHRKGSDQFFLVAPQRAYRYLKSSGWYEKITAELPVEADVRNALIETASELWDPEAQGSLASFKEALRAAEICLNE